MPFYGRQRLVLLLSDFQADDICPYGEAVTKDENLTFSRKGVAAKVSETAAGKTKGVFPFGF